MNTVMLIIFSISCGIILRFFYRSWQKEQQYQRRLNELAEPVIQELLEKLPQANNLEAVKQALQEERFTDIIVLRSMMPLYTHAAPEVLQHAIKLMIKRKLIGVHRVRITNGAEYNGDYLFRPPAMT